MRFIIALMIGGAVLLYFGVQEMRLSSAAKAEPQTITCDNLAKNGPGDNAHIVLSDFILLAEGGVYEAKSGSDTNWITFWAPLVPYGGEFHQEVMKKFDAAGKLTGEMPHPKSIDVIFKTKSVKNEAALAVVSQQDTLAGMVVNKIDTLGSEEKKLLASSYPGIDFDKCWIIEHGRKPAGMGKIAGFLGGGAGLILLPGIYLITRKNSGA
ncbi:MAG: hypothetical protein WD768_18025 [Phycisphaeraceae bacterium]